MSMVIANNMQAVNTKRQFATSSRGMSSAMEKLSSGYKINAGKDDPSGLLISEKLRSQINGLKRAQQNTEEAINVMGIAEGALNEMNSILKKMKALAIHSNNTGVTSPDQVAADQAEMDSAIQTLDRIAKTTKFSDQTLLNGSKDIAYNQDTLTKGTQNNSLLNTRESTFSQIYKRDNYSVAISFTGTQAANSVTGLGDVDFSQQAMKAYVELDTAKTGADGKANMTQVKDGSFTQEQAFTLTGSKGSRAFKFKKGDSVALMVSQIKSAADTTGIDASLVFNSDQRIDKMGIDGVTPAAGPASRTVALNGLMDADGKTIGLKLNGTAEQMAALAKAGVDINFTLEPGSTNNGTNPASKYDLKVSINGKAPESLITDWVPSAVNNTAIDTNLLAALTTALGADKMTEFGLNAASLAGMTAELTNPAISTVKSGTANFGATTLGADPVIDKLYSNTAGEGKATLTGFNFDNLSDELKEKIANSGADQFTLKLEKTGTTVGDLGFVVKLASNGTDLASYTITNDMYKKMVDANGVGSLVLGGDFAGAGITLDIANSGAAPVDTYGTAAADVTGQTGTAAGATNHSGVPTSKTFGSANMVFAPQEAGQTGGVNSVAGTARQQGTLAVFNNTLENDGTGAVKQGVKGVAMSATAADSIQFGMNTDGQGRIYVKFLDNNSFELYKDSSLSENSKIATGINGEEIKEYNNSGLSGLTLNLEGTDLAGKKGVYLAFAGIEGLSTNADGTTNGVKYNGSVVGTSQTGTPPVDDYEGKALFDSSRTLFTGVELGKNTSEDGQIYFKNVYNADDGTVQVFAYKHKDMKAEDLVAQSTTYNVKDAGSITVVLNEKRNSDDTAGTGLGIVMSVDADAFKGQNESTTLKGDVTFTNLGARIYSQEYGSDQVVKVTQDKGAIFTYYGSPGDNNSATLLDAGEDGKIIQMNGQDATLSVNGMQVKTNGLRLKMATQDIQADFTFNQGKVGSTTLAQVGYGDGSIFTKIGALNLGKVTQEAVGTKYEHLSGLLANAGHVTNEKINDFQGGMQLQLGEGAGDDDRTVVAIKSLTSENLGRVTKGGYWETGSSVYTNRTFSMKDVMGGGLASLSVDATLSMSIIDKAIADVSETRAQIGAVQSNLLQTNSNNLSVTIENITKTESGIRDADMADEMTEFTKQQVLQNAAMSMMSQANQASQNVLQLLR